MYLFTDRGLALGTSPASLHHVGPSRLNTETDGDCSAVRPPAEESVPPSVKVVCPLY